MTTSRKLFKNTKLNYLMANTLPISWRELFSCKATQIGNGLVDRRRDKRSSVPARVANTHCTLQSVSQSASVSYRTLLDPAVLAAALVDGTLPKGITPHVATLLDEAPLSLIVAAVEEVASTSSTPPKRLWKQE
jgi:hypothetical protein